MVLFGRIGAYGMELGWLESVARGSRHHFLFPLLGLRWSIRSMTAEHNSSSSRQTREPVLSRISVIRTMHRQ
jgi:hypothetical protein